MCVLRSQSHSLSFPPAAIPSGPQATLNPIYISHLHPPSDANIKNIGGMQTVSLQLLDALQRRSDLSVFPLSWSLPGGELK